MEYELIYLESVCGGAQCECDLPGSRRGMWPYNLGYISLFEQNIIIILTSKHMCI